MQVIPHITDEIKRRIALDATTNTTCILWKSAAQWATSRVCPFGGYPPVCRAERPPQLPVSSCDLVPYIAASQEMKTKPTQHSVKELLSLGIQPDIIVCRSERHLPAGAQG